MAQATDKDKALAFAKMVLLVNFLEKINEDIPGVHVKMVIEFWAKDVKDILETMEKDGWNPHSV